jgi:hypothetical protein
MEYNKAENVSVLMPMKRASTNSGLCENANVGAGYNNTDICKPAEAKNGQTERLRVLISH